MTKLNVINVKSDATSLSRKSKRKTNPTPKPDLIHTTDALTKDKVSKGLAKDDFSIIDTRPEGKLTGKPLPVDSYENDSLGG